MPAKINPPIISCVSIRIVHSDILKWHKNDESHQYKTMATVVTGDGLHFILDLELAKKCQVIRDCIEDSGPDAPIPIPNVNADVLTRIIEYYKTGDLSHTDNMLQLLSACDFLAYEELLDYGAKIVADSLKGKTETEIRRFFGLTLPS